MSSYVFVVDEEFWGRDSEVRMGGRAAGGHVRGSLGVAGRWVAARRRWRKVEIRAGVGVFIVGERSRGVAVVVVGEGEEVVALFGVAEVSVVE